MHHTGKACGSDSALIPWARLRPSKPYISTKYIPDDFILKDPSKLTRDEGRRLLLHWYSRQSRGAIAFRFGSYYDQNEDRPVKAVEEGNHAPRAATKRSKITNAQQPKSGAHTTSAASHTVASADTDPIATPRDVPEERRRDIANNVVESANSEAIPETSAAPGQDMERSGDKGDEESHTPSDSLATAPPKDGRKASLTQLEMKALDLDKSGTVLDRNQKAALTRAKSKLAAEAANNEHDGAGGGAEHLNPNHDDESGKRNIPPALDHGASTVPARIQGNHSTGNRSSTKTNLPAHPPAVTSRTDAANEAKRKRSKADIESLSSETEENVDSDIQRLDSAKRRSNKSPEAERSDSEDTDSESSIAAKGKHPRFGAKTHRTPVKNILYSSDSSDVDEHPRGSSRKYTNVPGSSKVVLELPFAPKRNSAPTVGIETRGKGLRKQVAPSSILVKSRKKQRLNDGGEDKLPVIPKKRVSKNAPAEPKK